MAEMWSTIIMTVLAWGFANDVTSVNDAKRTMAFWGSGSNLLQESSRDRVATSMSQNASTILHSPSAPQPWDQTVIFLVHCLCDRSLPVHGPLSRYSIFKGTATILPLSDKPNAPEPKNQDGNARKLRLFGQNPNI